jgi:hypothetical protein
MGQKNRGILDHTPDYKPTKVTRQNHPAFNWRGVKVETTNRWVKQECPSVHWQRTWQQTEYGTLHKQGLNSIQCFHVVFCICYYSVSAGDQESSTTNTWAHLRMIFLHYLIFLKLKCFCFWWLLFKWDIIYVCGSLEDYTHFTLCTLFK